MSQYMSLCMRCSASILLFALCSVFSVYCTPVSPPQNEKRSERTQEKKDVEPNSSTEPSVVDAAPDQAPPEDRKPPKPQLVEGPLTRFVDPFIGTGGKGFAVGSSLPGATAPFGMVKISPDTASHLRGFGFQHCAGYYHLDKEIVGFSHIHLHGTGVPDYGNLLVMPVVGDVTEKTIQEEGHRSPFRHETEEARPGYYKVTLDRSKTQVELTATTRAAYHRYTFDASASKRTVLLRLDHALPGGSVSEGELEIKDKHTIEGWLHSNGSMSKRGGGFDLYFVLKSKEAFISGTWSGSKLSQERKQKGKIVGAWIQYPKGQKPIEFKVGISFVSIENAKKNLESEIPDWSFDKIQKATLQAWEKELSVIRIAGGTLKQRRIFYTSLYHSFQMPTIFNDVDGRYRGLDKKVHQAQKYTYYSDFSLWDTYRTLHPLLVLLTPDRQRDMVRSLIAMARDGGELPRWPLGTSYTGTMVGASADIVIADTYLKGIRGFDIEYAYKAMRRLAMAPPPKDSAFGGRDGIKHYVQKGYVAADQHSGSASITLEYAYNDFSIAQLATALEKKEDAKLFYERSRNFRHIWDSKTQFFRAKKADGSWIPGFTDQRWTKDYVEGTAWQYLWFVPHDPEGLMKLFGSKEKLFKKLDTFFAKSKEEYDNEPDTLASRTYYWHGNEPDLHSAMLYTQLGKAHLTQRWVRWIMKHKYDDTPAGLVGNDDCGTLSAWYIFNAMGLYPIPGRDLYLITTPIFKRNVIQVGATTIEIYAPKTSEKAMYIRKATLNGKVLKHMWLRHTDLQKDGNVLHLEMSTTPPT